MENIEHVIPKLSKIESKFIVEICNKIIKKNKVSEFDEIPQFLFKKEPSLACKIIYLSLAKKSRKLNDFSFCETERNAIFSKIVKTEFLATQNLQYQTNFSEHSNKESIELHEAIRMVYNVSVGRYPLAEEIDIWIGNFKNNVIDFTQFFLAMLSSEEAKSKNKILDGKGILLSLNDGEFIQATYEILLGRFAKAWEIDLWRDQIEKSISTRQDILTKIFTSAYQIQSEFAKAPPHDGLSCLVMGTGKHVSIKDWELKASTLKLSAVNIAPPPPHKYAYNFSIRKESDILVSAIASMYCGGEFIEQFMDNITGQYGFSECCELIIVDADSPENEYEVIKRYLAKFKNINYIRSKYRIGIYEAWNVAAKAARGKYLTNTNMDDLRRYDSLMLQAGVLERFNFVDVVYQDLYYTFDPGLSFEEIAQFGLQTTLPVITPHNMLEFNSPHNAPMWRKRLHDDLGFFETRYQSAGDYDFWLRCLAAGKKFFKINEPHVVYYQNPKGLSTRPDTRGIAEGCEILKIYGRKLVSKDVVMSRTKFLESIKACGGGLITDGGDRYQLVQQSLRNISRTKKYSVSA